MQDNITGRVSAPSLVGSDLLTPLTITTHRDVQSFIWVTFQKEGIHRYPDAATNPELATGDWLDVSFLASPHRHIFHFRVELEVFHDDRDVEFIQMKRIIESWYSDKTLSVDHKSCEMLAQDLHQKIELWWPNRDVRIEVSEDNENGCRMYFNKTTRR
jgi:hypothetical protein